MKLKKKICALALAGAVALSALSLGFASWQTTISGSGSVNASGKWEVAITGAGLTLSSTGAEAALDYSGYQLTAHTLTASQTGNLCIQAAVPRTKTSASKVGTQSTSSTYKVSSFLCLIDTTRIDMTNFGSIPSNDRAALYSTYVNGNDCTAPIIRLSDTNVAPDGSRVSPVKAWYYYKNSSDYFGVDSARPVITSALIEQSDTLIKQLRPDTFQNYVLVCFVCDSATELRDQSHLQFVIASMDSADGTQPSAVSFTDTAAAYAPVSFSIPDAWAAYTLTVTNSGTADANLKDVVITLDTEAPDQLELNTPDLSDEMLSPGQSCQITVVVQALDDGSGALDASGTLTITLPYSQTAVETAPEAGHSHG